MRKIWLLGVVFVGVLANEHGGRLAAAESAAGLATGPFSPAEALSQFVLHPDFRIELAAAEPDVIDPVHVAFDAAGRMWVVEYSDYPHGPAEGQPGKSRIRTLTDIDGDGRYSDPVLFADKLLFATGLLPWKDGVIVTSAGSVSFLRDTNGDGRSDETQEWFVGFMQENPQLRANHPTFAIDNHIYVASGIRGGEVGPGKDWAAAFGRDPAAPPKPVSLSGRDFRFDPLTGDFEAVSGPGQFGLCFDDWGRRFVCDNRHPCKQIMIEEWHLRGNPQVAITQTWEDVMPAGEQSRLYPLSRTFTTSNLHTNQFTAACGLCVYRGPRVAPWNHDEPGIFGRAFVCDPTANLVHSAVLSDGLVALRDKRAVPGRTQELDQPEPEFLATRDEWFRPVNIVNGPEGALYVVDMYRAVVEHPQFMPEELRTRPDLLLGTDKGRVYRIVPKQSAGAVLGVGAARFPRPENSSTELAAMLQHPNGWHRDLAQQALLLSTAPFDERAAAVRPVLQADSAVGRAHAAWLLASWGRLTSDELNSLIVGGHQLGWVDGKLAERPQSASLGTDERWLSVVGARIAAAQESITDGTRLALRVMIVNPGQPSLAYEALLAFAVHDSHGNVEPYTKDIAEPAAADLWVIQASRLAIRQPAAALTSLLTHYGPPDRSSRRFDPKNRDDVEAAPFLFALAELTGRAVPPATAIELIAETRRQLSPPSAASANVLLGLFSGLRVQKQSISELCQAATGDAAACLTQHMTWAEQTAFDASNPRRMDAVSLLEFGPPNSTPRLIALADHGPDLPVRQRAIEVLARRSDPEVNAWLTADLASFSPELRNARVAALFQSTPRMALLLDEIEAERLPARLIDPNRAKQLTGHRDPTIRDRALKLFALETPAARKQVLADYQTSLTLASDPLQGQAVFKSQCATCHRIGELGVNVAPDISDSRAKTREYLLTSILDPNQAIDNNYFSYTVVDREGLVHTGVLATETSTSITLKQPEGKELTIPRDQIEQFKSNGVSLMPEGLERNITPQQMADLISFIKNWRYLDGSVPREVIR